MKEIEVWHASLDGAAEEIRGLHDLLDASERARAKRFHADADRDRFIVARGTLRSLLSQYTSIPPASLSILKGEGGKPLLEPEINRCGIHFNVSHCGGLGLFAFWDHNIGVDVQRIEDNSDISRVASHFFSPDERIAFERLPAETRTAFFFRVWVRKEAYLKATGEGLSIDPSAIDVANWNVPYASRRSTAGTMQADINYLLKDIDNVAGHAAAIAFRTTSDEPVIRLREWALPASAGGGRFESRAKPLNGRPSTPNQLPD